jgi:acetyl-CoA carboxylase biotin carboxyl carrier protein
MSERTGVPEAGALEDSTARSETAPAVAGAGLVRAVQALLELLAEAQVTEIEVALGDTQIFARRGRGGFLAGRSTAHPAQLSPVEAYVPVQAQGLRGVADERDDGEELVRVLSPLTGVFYLTPSPNAPPYVQEGSFVERDQVVGLVEAMKTFNEVRAETSGTVVRILVQSGELVQVNQPLMLIRPGGEDMSMPAPA